MAMQEFMAPDFVAGQSAEEVHARMMAALPLDIDRTPGGFPYDLTYPTALEKSELVEFHIAQTLMLMFPMWAFGPWLDMHARSVGLERRPANAASGKIRITGITGTIVPAGTLFAVPANGDAPAIEYTTPAETAIHESGRAAIAVMAVEAGPKGNVGAHSISVMVSPIKGVSAIDNPEAMTGGTAEEDDESLRSRIDDVNAAQSMSYVGNNSDYRRWAMEVGGVGDAIVQPLWAGNGTVKLVIVDSNGQPANAAILQAVYDHIMGPRPDSLERLAGIGVDLTVVAPEALPIGYAASVFLDDFTDLGDVRNLFAEALQSYYAEADKDKILRYTRVCSLLSDIAGVKDFTDFTIDGGTGNIRIDADEYPVTASIDFVMA